MAKLKSVSLPAEQSDNSIPRPEKLAVGRNGPPLQHDSDEELEEEAIRPLFSDEPRVSRRGGERSEYHKRFQAVYEELNENLTLEAEDQLYQSNFAAWGAWFVRGGDTKGPPPPRSIDSLTNQEKAWWLSNLYKNRICVEIKEALSRRISKQKVDRWITELKPAFESVGLRISDEIIDGTSWVEHSDQRVAKIVATLLEIIEGYMPSGDE